MMFNYVFEVYDEDIHGQVFETVFDDNEILVRHEAFNGTFEYGE